MFIEKPSRFLIFSKYCKFVYCSIYSEFFNKSDNLEGCSISEFRKPICFKYILYLKFSGMTID